MRPRALRWRLSVTAVLAGIALLGAPAGFAVDEPPGAADGRPVVYLAQIEGVIDLGLAPFVQRVLGRDAGADRMAPEQVKVLVTSLTEGRWTHDYPIAPPQARALGLNVKDGVPEDVHALMDLYPPSRRTRPAVQYVPIHGEEVGELTAKRRVRRGR